MNAPYILVALVATTAAVAGAWTIDAPPRVLPPDGPTAREAAAAAHPTLRRIADCESGGDPRAVSAGGTYRGKYQFDRSTWRSVGGSGDPAAAGEREQDRRALTLLERSGTAPWPSCGV